MSELHQNRSCVPHDGNSEDYRVDLCSHKPSIFSSQGPLQRGRDSDTLACTSAFHPEQFPCHILLHVVSTPERVHWHSATTRDCSLVSPPPLYRAPQCDQCNFGASHHSEWQAKHPQRQQACGIASLFPICSSCTSQDSIEILHLRSVVVVDNIFTRHF